MKHTVRIKLIIVGTSSPVISPHLVPLEGKENRPTVIMFINYLPLLILLCFGKVIQVWTPSMNFPNLYNSMCWIMNFSVSLYMFDEKEKVKLGHRSPHLPIEYHVKKYISECLIFIAEF